MLAARVEVRHVSAGRLRLRVRAGTGDDGSLRRLVEGLERHPRVTQASFNPTTRSVLVLHDGEPKDVLAFGERQSLFSLAKPEPRSFAHRTPPSQRLAGAISTGIKSIDAGVMSSSQGRVDLPTLAIASLLGAALWRARGGELLPSAVSLVSIAFGIAGLKRRA
jgi:hypothetical protein